ncbi:MAG: FIST C-terminal domain-containing protein [Gammaproteobacteria bacterium]|nr:FIST C-terminal domain-containing protein [Gammaproteobacteria bacterium]
MERFFSLSSQHESPQQVISDAVEQLKAAPDEANFGFLYVTDALSDDFPELLQQCKKATGIEHWVGTMGIGIVATNQEMYDLPAASIMLAHFNSDDFTMLPLISEQQDIGSKISWPRPFATNFGLLHCDPGNPNTQNLIEDIQHHIANGFIVGGLTSSRDKHFQISDNVISGGVSGVLFSENVAVLTNLSQGCRPVGDKYSITKAQENAILQLDNKPALEILMQDMHISDIEELKTKGNSIFVGLCIPGSDKSDYTVRNLIGIDTQQQIFAVNDYLTEGNEIIFCERNEQTAIDDMQQMLSNLAGRLTQKIKGGIYISCLGRGRQQFGKNSEEIKMIHQTLGDFPLTGFFANGEIHHNQLYGYTGVLTLFT